MKMYQNCCKKCGSISLHIEQQGNHVGLYCDDCGSWIKWISKDELRAFKFSQQGKDKNTEENDDNKIRYELNRFAWFLEVTICNECNMLPASEEDAIRKNAYCLGLERVKNSIINILNDKPFDFEEG